MSLRQVKKQHFIVKFWNLVPKLWHKFPSADFFKYEITPPYRAYNTYLESRLTEDGKSMFTESLPIYLMLSIIFCIQHIVLYNTVYVVLQKEESI